jgi:hypothetical protein
MVISFFQGRFDRLSPAWTQVTAGRLLAKPPVECQPTYARTSDLSRPL